MPERRRKINVRGRKMVSADQTFIKRGERGTTDEGKWRKRG